MTTKRILLTAAMLVVATMTASAQPAGSGFQKVRFAEGVRAINPMGGAMDYSAFVPGLYIRPMVKTASIKGDSTVTVWALFVGPKSNTAEAKLPGAAMLNLVAGSVDLVTPAATTRLLPGSTAEVPEGTSLHFVNIDETHPAHLRAILTAVNH